MPCCADAAAASVSAAALRRCGCAQDGYTPLHWAADNGHVACVALLVERGANKDAKTNVRCAAPSPAAAPDGHNERTVACLSERDPLCSIYWGMVL
jgi:hypothetical protein